MRKLNVTVMVGVIVAVLGAGMVFAYGQSVDRRIANGKDPVPVLIADDDLAAGTSVGSLRGRVHVEKVPGAYVVTGALGGMSALSSISSGAVLSGPLPKGAQLARSAVQVGEIGAVGDEPTVNSVLANGMHCWQPRAQRQNVDA